MTNRAKNCARIEPASQDLGTTMLLIAMLGVSSMALSAAPGQTSQTEIERLFDEDQKDRQVNMIRMTPEERAKWWDKVSARDEQRRKQVLELIAKSALTTGEDYEEAAFIFQHGIKPDDFLLAHTLAMVAIAKGSSKARWIAAATLDRYLQNIQQPQIFGTQYTAGPQTGEKWTQAPYNHQLVPDALRNAMCVPDSDSQTKTVEAMNQGKEPTERKKIPGCN